MHVIYDIEADGLLPDVEHIWSIGICNVGTTEVQTYTDYDPNYPSLKEGIARLKQAERTIGHNVVGYDMPVINKFFPGTLTFEQQWCTMTVGALVDPQRRRLTLESYGEQLGFAKGDFHDFSRYTDEMRTYMERDVQLTSKLYDFLQMELRKLLRTGSDYRQAITLEHQVQAALQAQAQHGFKFDVQSAEALSVKLSEDLLEHESALKKLFTPIVRPIKGNWCFKKKTWTNVDKFTPQTNNNRLGYQSGAELARCRIEMFNPGSRDQVAVRLNQLYDWKPVEFTNDGKPKLDETTLSTLEFPPAKILRDYYRLQKMQGMLSEGNNAWLRLHSKGRMHGYVRSCGSRTHRMSHSRPNMAQVDKSKEMRSLWIPDDDHVLVGVDADALELRMLACFLYKYDNGAYAESVLHGTKEAGTDPHTLNQKAAGLYSRDAAKTLYYALIYGASDKRIGGIVADDLQAAGHQLPPKRSLPQLGGQARRNIESGVKGLGSLIKEVENRAETRGYVHLPDGRRAQTTARTALNTLLQGSGSILMKQALALFYFELIPKEGLVHGHDFGLVANVHDEQQITCKPEHAELIGELFAMAIGLAGKRLNLPVPFSGDYRIGKNWSETH